MITTIIEIDKTRPGPGPRPNKDRKSRLEYNCFIKTLLYIWLPLLILSILCTQLGLFFQFCNVSPFDFSGQENQILEIASIFRIVSAVLGFIAGVVFPCVMILKTTVVIGSSSSPNSNLYNWIDNIKIPDTPRNIIHIFYFTFNILTLISNLFYVNVANIYQEQLLFKIWSFKFTSGWISITFYSLSVILLLPYLIFLASVNCGCALAECCCPLYPEVYEFCIKAGFCEDPDGDDDRRPRPRILD